MDKKVTKHIYHVVLTDVTSLELLQSIIFNRIIIILSQKYIDIKQ